MKSLIVYFSHVGENWVDGSIKNIEIGNTERVVLMLKEMTGGDIVRVEECDRYPYSYQECCDVAKRELNDNVRPRVKEVVKSIDQYEVVYICSPIWWGHLPMVMFSALDGVNWEGHCVKFVVTHEGSGLGSVPDDIRKLCVGAKIEDGLAIVGSCVDDSRDKLLEYVDMC